MPYEIELDWTTQAGLRAVVIICKSGERKTHRCGYVGLPAEHPLNGVGYHEQADCLTEEMVSNAPLGNKSPLLLFTATCSSDGEDKIRRSPDIAFDVHGGLTYSGGKGSYPVPAELWWFGFDCHHCDDGEIEPDPHYPSFFQGEVRELPYVKAECERLAKQLAAIRVLV